MSEMVERVRLAISAGATTEQARAAIEAMREPSEAMLGATEEIAVHYDEREYFCSSATAEAVWEAMVNRALKD